MTLFYIVYQYLKARPLNTALNILLLAAGTSIITTVLLFSVQFEHSITKNTRGVDLVVGAKGSPLQLVLCNLLQADIPTGNIKLSDADRLANNKMVARAIPLALGDRYQGFRIVGTNRRYAVLYHAHLAQGKWWTRPLQAVVGATVAKTSGLKVGDYFSSEHGLTEIGHVHKGEQYMVRGILQKKNSVIDNLILCNVESVWKIHEKQHPEAHEPPTYYTAESGSTLSQSANGSLRLKKSKLVPSLSTSDTTHEITALLIQYRSPLAAFQLPRYINRQTAMLAASPAFELTRLFSSLGIAIKLLQGFSGMLIFIAALSIFIALYNSLRERQYDLALMRAMGASRSKLSLSVLLEGMALTLQGSLLGIGLAHLATWKLLQVADSIHLTGIRPDVVIPEEYALLGGSTVLGILCALLPAWQAYRTDISITFTHAI